MNAGEYAGTVFVTALGGFDPAPMIIMAAALGAGVRRRHIMGASALLLGGTAAWGVALTLLVGPRLQRVDWWALVRHGSTAAWVEVGLAVALGGYALWRAVSRRRARGEPTPEKPAASPWALYTTSLVFVGIVVLDIPFDVHVAVAASQPLPRMVLGWVVWALLSQIALTALVLLTLLGRQERFSAVMRRAWAAVAPRISVVVTALLGLASLLMLLDAGLFLWAGQFLFV
ncbi:hypothetical protein OG312_06030 [Kocuria rhizophila]|uniref:hypothetical protein n=1 Tax=Kocuria TaxID=57493 RepID=UPI0021A925ED|nr:MULTISPECIES: hypothetical protein [Kocuria]MCT1545548.1 hypothetical protein [Kocuria rhizophila]MCT2172627.1 hypothetical protein [Kocuria rhizophila]MDN3461396.1 hypothetical protein [Kocuria sp. APC 4018]WSQ03980.1 hypothetical protein OG312_06030 [Kocuria rhizophila]WSY87932.1 hypothetical protein OH783_09770 [Kocuria rhizophila]